jgi:hypothetical protein
LIYINSIEGDAIMNCQYCSREIKNKGSLSAHQISCRDNPERIPHKRSEFSGWTKGKPSPLKGRKIGRNAIWDEKYPLESVLVENSTYARHALKKRILEHKLIAYICSCCGIEPFWNGNPMPLILDHINGVNNDNRIENLRFVCSNCDTQLDTYKSKNK